MKQVNCYLIGNVQGYQIPVVKFFSLEFREALDFFPADLGRGYKKFSTTRQKRCLNPLGSVHYLSVPPGAKSGGGSSKIST